MKGVGDWGQEKLDTEPTQVHLWKPLPSRPLKTVTRTLICVSEI
jgi:hypothetical protein